VSEMHLKKGLNYLEFVYEQVQATIDCRDGIVGGNMVGSNQSAPNVNKNPFREDFRYNTFNDS
jgi:hypothetical protein